MAVGDPLPGVLIDHFERRLRVGGFELIAGVDEVGRGALAGPMVAGAVILPPGFDCQGLKDSSIVGRVFLRIWPPGRIGFM